MKNKMSKKIIVILVLIAIVVLMGGVILWSNWNQKNNNNEISSTNGNKDTKINVVLSLEDKIVDDTVWCGTFNLIWNDLKNDLVKKDIEFSPQLETVRNLNKGTFNISHLSDNSYYKTYGVPSLALKEEIEKAIKEKFNETSDILDDFNWENHGPEDYFLYAMLKKQFEFPKVFTELEEGEFSQYDKVEYFGINKNTEEEVRNQVKVLYYESKDNFAIQLETKGNDEVIISKGSKKQTFGECYQDVKEKSQKYEGSRNFEKIDILKIPNIKFDLKEEIKELEQQYFEFANGNVYRIDKAVQTIQFELDKKGGKIKSEAGMMLDKAAIMLPEGPREFLVDDTFTMFLIEEEKELPYFATKISDITKVQNNQ